MILQRLRDDWVTLVVAVAWCVLGMSIKTFTAAADRQRTGCCCWRGGQLKQWETDLRWMKVHYYREEIKIWWWWAGVGGEDTKRSAHFGLLITNDDEPSARREKKTSTCLVFDFVEQKSRPVNIFPEIGLDDKMIFNGGAAALQREIF